MRKIFRLLCGILFIGGLAYTTNVSAMERHAVYLERNYADTRGVMHHLTAQGYIMAEKEFTNTIDPYARYQIIDAFNDKKKAIMKINEAFKNSKEEDINYVVIESHGYSGGIIDFSFQELKYILDQYKGRFVINIFACHSGGAINKMQVEAQKVFKQPKNKMGEFENSRYNVFCSSSKTNLSYFSTSKGFSPYTKAYFDAAKQGKNGFLNADYNQDNVVTTEELAKYVSDNRYFMGVPTVSQIADSNLPVFAVNRNRRGETKASFDFYGIGTWAKHDTHFAQVKYNGDYTVSVKEGIEMYGSQIHPYFKDAYACILATDKNNNLLFRKIFKGIDYAQIKNETFSLPEGALLSLYHAEGASERFTTSNNAELKSKFRKKDSTMYVYRVQNNSLVLQN